MFVAWLNPVYSKSLCGSNGKDQEVRVSECEARSISRVELTGYTLVYRRVHRIGMVACFISEIVQARYFREKDCL